MNEAATVTIDGRPASVDPSNTFRGTGQTTAGTTTVTVTARDGAGNTATQAYEVDVTGGSSAYTYDANGNLTSDGVKTYQWNARNELIRVQQGGSDLATFTYDGLGRRVTKAAAGITHTYVYDGEDIVEERLSSGETLRYIHGPGIDQVLARTTNGATPVYYLTDHLGSVVQEVDATQAVTLNREYDPWGVPVQGGATSGYAFTGREWDAEVGLHYSRLRYLDVSTGRFLSQDPIGFLGGINQYAYVNGRPLIGTDPFGLCSAEEQNLLNRYLDFTATLHESEQFKDVEVMEAAPVDPRRIVLEILKGYRKHGLDQVIARDGGRGVDPSAILDALRNPAKIVEQVNGTIKYVGEKATVVLNKAGQLVTAYGKPRTPKP